MILWNSLIDLAVERQCLAEWPGPNNSDTDGVEVDMFGQGGTLRQYNTNGVVMSTENNLGNFG